MSKPTAKDVTELYRAARQLLLKTERKKKGQEQDRSIYRRTGSLDKDAGLSIYKKKPKRNGKDEDRGVRSTTWSFASWFCGPRACRSGRLRTR